MHIILISESWLKPSLLLMLVSLSGYKILRNDRINKGGGGVAIYYTGKPEFIIIELTNPTNKVLLAVVYRPPKAAYLYDFEEALLMPWHEINTIDTVDEKISHFSHMISDLYNRMVPLRTRHVTKPPALWLTNDIVQLMRKFDNAYSRHKRDI
ncbi:hypothetical protein PR048_017327 [Dryococelus australis]|uniref:Uncharacterized protein n=1 Tax=Dryococelus australis TaxID=614101 RepID=A0ABQ9H9E8_9NEOP|nr:hypothetical protein PR048_017327 [Dryococelus australis]